VFRVLDTEAMLDAIVELTVAILDSSVDESAVINEVFAAIATLLLSMLVAIVADKAVIAELLFEILVAIVADNAVIAELLFAMLVCNATLVLDKVAETVLI
jgi:hypothetical protein